MLAGAVTTTNAQSDTTKHLTGGSIQPFNEDEAMHAHDGRDSHVESMRASLRRIVRIW